VLPPASAPEQATGAQTEILAGTALEMLAASGYLQRHPRANMQAEARRLIRRMHLNGKDTEAVLGMLRQALWKIRNSPANPD
jgi:tRNA/rRNA methyltransferase